MRKFINFVKKQLLIISAALLFVSSAAFVVVSMQPHGKKYEYSDSFFGVGMDITFTFKSKNTVELEMFVAGMETKGTYQYKIKDGNLYTFNSDTGVWGRDGEIDAFEIELQYPVSEEMGYLSGLEIELVCKQNKLIKAISVAMIIMSGIVLACCAAVLVLDKKGMLKFLFKTENAEASAVETENAEAVQVEAQPVEIVEESVQAEAQAEPVVETTETKE